MSDRAHSGRHRWEIPLWRDVTEEQWNDWRWQVKNSLRSIDTLRQVVRLTAAEEEGLLSTREVFQMAITPYYATLMDPEDAHCPVRRQAVPNVGETRPTAAEMADPLTEDEHIVAPNLVHRYPDRALLLVNNMCAMYCRFCTRKRYTGCSNETLPRAEFQQCLDYLRAHPEIRDVLVSGGDPFIMSDARLDELLAGLRSVPTIEVIRIGTRIPVVMPMRVTDELCATLRKYAPVWVNTHFNHPKELTPAAREACGRLLDHGIPMGNQTVLLKGINSSCRTLKTLFQQLVASRVWPYYLYQCDLVEGTDHFRTPVAKGLEIMEQLRGHTSGFAIPTFVIDTPGGGGKIPLGPQYLVTASEKEVTLRNFEFRTFHYPETEERDCTCAYEGRYFGEAGEVDLEQAANDWPRRRVRRGAAR
ncbi:MAG TPA: KamA family radical SAM protein [Polyangia bacterium]